MVINTGNNLSSSKMPEILIEPRSCSPFHLLNRLLDCVLIVVKRDFEERNDHNVRRGKANTHARSAPSLGCR